MAAITGTALVAGAAVYSANKQSKAAGNAANAQANAANQANATQQQMYQQQRADQEPFRQAGLTAMSQYMTLLGLQAPQSLTNAVQGPPQFTQQAAQAYLAANPDVAADPYWGKNPWLHYTQHGALEGRSWGSQQTAQAGSGQGQQGQGAQTTQQAQQAAFAQFRNTPGYQFGFTEGQRALNTSANAAGGLFSGKAGKALVRYGNDYADQQGFTPYMNRLASLFGGAQTATNAVGAAGQNYANQFGANLQNAAAARASGLQASANAQGQMVQGLAGVANYGLQQWAANRAPAYPATSSAPSYAATNSSYRIGTGPY